MSTVKKLVLDIETVGHDFDSFDEKTQKGLTAWIKKTAIDKEDYEKKVENLKNELGLSPLTGEIVSIGVLDHHSQEGAVYFQAPGEKIAEFSEDNVKYKAMEEKAMLEAFWKGAAQYEEFITFNGRMFDIPFLMLRSAILGVRPTKDLMRGRYVYQQAPNAIHIDLYDQLTFYGASTKKGSLHLFVRAFGIISPKEDGVDGSDVKGLFEDKKYKEIAEYNSRDIFATSALYQKWNDYLRF